LKIDQKKQIVEEIRDKFARSKVVIVTDYKGLDVAAINDLRRKLREENVEYQVVKNTLLSIAAEGTDVAVIKERFKGPSAIALSYADPVGPAKILTKFADENKKFEIKFGAMGGKALDLPGIKALSSLPSREVLLAQVLSAMNGVPTALVRALNDVPTRLVNVLRAIREQKEAA
jgi:large subunit ribosomal protein L10